MQNFLARLLPAALVLIAIVAGGFGFLLISNAQSAIHEIEGLICLLALTVAVGTGVIVGAIKERK